MEKRAIALSGCDSAYVREWTGWLAAIGFEVYAVPNPGHVLPLIDERQVDVVAVRAADPWRDPVLACVQLWRRRHPGLAVVLI